MIGFDSLLYTEYVKSCILYYILLLKCYINIDLLLQLTDRYKTTLTPQHSQ